MGLLAILTSFLMTTSFFVWALTSSRLGDRVEQYVTLPDRPAPHVETARSVKVALNGFFAAHITPYLPSGYAQHLRSRLRQAGYYGGRPFKFVLLLQGLLASAGLLAAPWLQMQPGWLIGPALAALGWMLPTFVLARMVKTRQAAIAAALPDTVDLLTASTEAGLGLDAAIALLLKRKNRRVRAINQELARYLQEIHLGVPRSEALRGPGLRSGVPELKQVFAALVQSDALGVGVSQVLRAQSQHLRIRRKQQAEEKAMKAPIKIVFPLVFCIFPAIFVVIVGPGALRLIDAFTQLR